MHTMKHTYTMGGNVTTHISSYIGGKGFPESSSQTRPPERGLDNDWGNLMEWGLPRGVGVECGGGGEMRRDVYRKYT